MRYINLIIICILNLTLSAQSSIIIDTLLPISKENSFVDYYNHEDIYFNLYENQELYYEHARLLLEDNLPHIRSSIRIFERYMSIENIQAIECFVMALYLERELNDHSINIDQSTKNPIEIIILGYTSIYNNNMCRAKYYFEKAMRLNYKYGSRFYRTYDKVKEGCDGG